MMEGQSRMDRNKIYILSYLFWKVREIRECNDNKKSIHLLMKLDDFLKENNDLIQRFISKEAITDVLRCL
jgi:hypothetical protein